MLSVSRKFLFIHIPKTGGNSVQDALREYSDDQFVRLAPHQDGVERFELRSNTYGTEKHSTVADYRAQYGPLYNGLFKFTCVRNPWDRAISFYFSPHRGSVRWDRRAFIGLLAKINPACHYIGAERMDFVMRFESLREDFSAVCKTLGVKASLPHRNASTRATCRSYYDEETYALVASRFREDIERFGYHHAAVG